MGALNRYKYHILVVLILGLVALMSIKTRFSSVTKSADDLPKVGTRVPLRHALELFPSNKASLAIYASGGVDLRGFILDTVTRSLPNDQRSRAFEVARAVIVEANHNRLDPMFLLAVIATESQFNLAAHGTHGEIGLMQIMPSTAKWLAPQAGLAADFKLEEPAINIRLGALYMSQLRNRFKHRSKRYVSAYNMGARNVRRLVKAHTEPKIYVTRVLNNYEQIYTALAAPQRVNVARRIAWDH